MIEPDKRKAIFLLHQEGMSIREIARRLGVSRNTVGPDHHSEGSHAGYGTQRQDPYRPGAPASACTTNAMAYVSGSMRSWWRRRRSRSSTPR